MTFHLKPFILLSFLVFGQATLASPHDDARLIVQRSSNPESLEFFQRSLRKQFVDVYFHPIAGQGVRIADEERFMDLIPDEDVSPFIDRLLSETVENFVSTFSAEQLAAIAAVMRLDENATLQEILSEQYRQEYVAALSEARSGATPSGSDDPLVVGLEEVIIRLDAMTRALDANAGKALVQHMTMGVGFISALLKYNQEITQMNRELDNPVISAALKADGILSFSNPVQRQILLRERSVSEGKSGARFLKPPSASAKSD